MHRAELAERHRVPRTSCRLPAERRRCGDCTTGNNHLQRDAGSTGGRNGIRTEEEWLYNELTIKTEKGTVTLLFWLQL